MLPSLFPFDGSTQPVKAPPRKASVLIKQHAASPVTVEVEVQPDRPADPVSKTSVEKTLSGGSAGELWVWFLSLLRLLFGLLIH